MARASSSVAADTAAASASQRSCSRSVLCARRERPSSDPAPTTRPSRVTSTQGRNSAARAGTARGLPTAGCSGYRGLGSVTRASTPSATAVAATLAHQRQRGDGSLPVGVSSNTKPTHDSRTRTIAF